MKKYYTTFLIALIVSAFSTTLAQTKTGNSKITGSVIDDKQQALDFATVSLLKAKDSTLVKTAMTDIAGNYFFEKVAA
ncbi:MAG TPA: hypothetical protein VEV16_02350, partial [Daejeonella sp.]|nr:hypothetical protein [Daejeonella sp.]